MPCKSLQETPENRRSVYRLCIASFDQTIPEQGDLRVGNEAQKRFRALLAR
jgi:hypothetical protein